MDKAQFLERLPIGAVNAQPAPKGPPLAPPLDKTACLTDQLRGNNAGLHEVNDLEAAVKKALELAAKSGAGRVGLAPFSEALEIKASAQAEDLGLRLVTVQDGDPDAIGRCEPLAVGVTKVDLAVAETGQIVQLARKDGGRLMSLLPKWHIAILCKDDILPNLPALAERLSDAERFPQGPPAVASMIGAPSKTGDIEGIIVYGAHGPRKLDVIIWG